MPKIKASTRPATIVEIRGVSWCMLPPWLWRDLVWFEKLYRQDGVSHPDVQALPTPEMSAIWPTWRQDFTKPDAVAQVCLCYDERRGVNQPGHRNLSHRQML